VVVYSNALPSNIHTYIHTFPTHITTTRRPTQLIHYITPTTTLYTALRSPKGASQWTKMKRKLSTMMALKRAHSKSMRSIHTVEMDFGVFIKGRSGKKNTHTHIYIYTLSLSLPHTHSHTYTHAHTHTQPSAPKRWPHSKLERTSASTVCSGRGPSERPRCVCVCVRVCVCV
jgi:hypothetical protein